MGRSKLFVRLQTIPDQMTDAELRATLRNRDDAVVIRTLLLAEVEAIRAGAERELRTMRSMWYDAIKPVLSRAGLLNQKTKHGNPIEWDAKLSDYLADLVRMGLTSYEELYIVDGSRQRQAATAITRTITEVQLVGAHFPWVILFTEKDAIYPQVEALAQLYGVSAISGGGQPSHACTENTVRAIVRSEAFRREQPEAIVILALTDYDPAGYSIAESQFAQVEDAVNNLSDAERGRLQNVFTVRLGLEPEQLTPEARKIKSYEPKPKGLDDWYQKTGGVDGQRLGLESDALPLSRLRAMFAEGIEQHIDLSKRFYDLRDGFVDLVIYEMLLPGIEAKRAAMRAAMVDSGRMQAIEDHLLPADLFRRAAVAGYNAIDPTEHRLFDGQREAMETELADLTG